MAVVELTEAQITFLQDWLDAELPDPDERGVDVAKLVDGIDEDNLDLNDLWMKGRTEAEAALSDLRVALERENEPNLDRIAKFGLLDVLGGHHVKITMAIMAYQSAKEDDRASKGQALVAALDAFAEHLRVSPFVALVEENGFVPVRIAGPLGETISSLRNRIDV